jgi:hypothetical protein
MPRFENQTFTDEDVILHGNEYVGCRFIRCSLYYDEGSFSLEDCVFDSPILQLQGSALQTVRLLEYLGYTIDHPGGIDRFHFHGDSEEG